MPGTRLAAVDQPAPDDLIGFLMAITDGLTAVVCATPGLIQSVNSVLAWAAASPSPGAP